ncbi:hypothetical protein FSP39_000136 [Pinctada imbricata]|uniref:Ran-GTPase activating protein 1 C-terminal domain-containing protein n=1 Tax=Pinctada imbricata TaxID=66713 RepID=A0AA88Y6T4_PINIB|nr:hypothetical protein FSP39_000136 [Pinctada imbricata]
MASSDVSDVADQLAKTKVDEQYELNFKGRGLKLNTAEDAKDIIKEIEECRTMTALRLEGNTMGVEAAEAIAKAIQKHPEFKRALWSDMFTGRLKTEIPKALQFLGDSMIQAGVGLVELDLSDNAFGPNGVVGLVDFIKSPSCYTLQELRLNNNGLGIGGGKMLAESLTECHKRSMEAGKPFCLKVFISGRNRLENDGAMALAKVFKLVGTLEEVAMPQNGIYHPGITALADAFSQNPRLKILNLSDNTFTQAGAKSMAKVLPKLQEIEVINFSDCLLKTEGALALSKALKEGHTKLKELNLYGNEINKTGANAVAENMENKPALLRLDLNCNMLGEEGVDEVRGTMEAMGKLDALASLSEDEGSDEEDEEHGDGDGEEIPAEEEREGEVVDDPALQVKGKAITPKKQTVSIKEFVSFPSPSKLIGLGDQRAQVITDELGQDISDMEKAVQMFMKVSSVVTQDDMETKEAACQCADRIMEETIQRNADVAAAMVANTLLVYLGVIKGEDKKYRPPSNITGPLLILEHMVRQPYFPKFSREILQTFIGKPNPILDHASTARHKLLQTLFTF